MNNLKMLNQGCAFFFLHRNRFVSIERKNKKEKNSSLSFVLNTTRTHITYVICWPIWMRIPIFFLLLYSTWPSEIWSSHEFGLHVLFLTSVDSIEMSNSTIFECWMECTNLGTDFLIKRIILEYIRKTKEFFRQLEKMLLNLDVFFFFPSSL